MDNTAEIITGTVTMRDVLSRYHNLGKKNRCSCPIHNGKDNNFAYTDKVFHCWTCGAKGNVISFVMQMFNLNFRQALMKINIDFGLNLSLQASRQSAETQQRADEIRKVRQAEYEKKMQKEREYDKLISEYVWCDMIIRELQPKKPADEIYDVYVRAMHKLPIIQYKLDCFE